MKDYLSLIKFSHTIFALPFAMVGYFLAVETDGYTFDNRMLLLVILCMVFARSAAMAFNRYLDREIDRANPRTQTREIPAGVLEPNAVLAFVVFNAVAFIVVTYFINPLCFYLSPVALLITLGYSYTKRFTALCHMVLGLGLALAPVGAYLAVTGTFDMVPVLYGVVVLCWVAGFDILYALQDEALDKSLNLHSTPVKLGRSLSMRVSEVLHIIAAGVLLYNTYYVTFNFIDSGPMLWVGSVIFVGLLIYQHLIISAKDLSRINMAFFTTNGIASVVFGLAFVIDILT